MREVTDSSCREDVRRRKMHRPRCSRVDPVLSFAVGSDMHRLLIAISLVLLFFTGIQGCAEDWKLTPLKYNQEDLVVDLGVGLWAWPMPLDYDRDGDMDLLVACPDKPSNGVYFFENPTAGSWQ